MLKIIEGSDPQGLYKLGNPANGRFHYPVGKRRTKENHEVMRAAERKLDEFCGRVDRNLDVKRQWHLDHIAKCDNCCDCDVDTAVRKLLSESRYVQRNGEWVEPNNKEPVAVTQSRVDAPANRPLSELYFDLERRTERPIDCMHTHGHQHHDHSNSHSRGKLKPKTKGTPGKENIPPVAVAAEETSPKDDYQPTFALHAKALKVFRTLFFASYISSTPGGVPWTDFLQAMAATGFAPEKLYGSVWTFSPTALDVERSIQFHEPHATGKIPYRTCRRHGRRLKKAYGWHSRMFVLSEKAQEDTSIIN